jgi:hypothetical protein
MSDPRIIPAEVLARYEIDAKEFDTLLYGRPNRVLALIEHGKALAEQVGTLTRERDELYDRPEQALVDLWRDRADDTGRLFSQAQQEAFKQHERADAAEAKHAALLGQIENHEGLAAAFMRQCPTCEHPFGSHLNTRPGCKECPGHHGYDRPGNCPETRATATGKAVSEAVHKVIEDARGGQS